MLVIVAEGKGRYDEPPSQFEIYAKKVAQGKFCGKYPDLAKANHMAKPYVSRVHNPFLEFIINKIYYIAPVFN